MMLQHQNKRAHSLELVESPSFIHTDESSNDDTYFRPPYTRSQGPTNGRPAMLDDSRGRFVAGQAFFNYDAFGSLREGLDPVRLQGPAHIGLLINAIAAGCSLTFFQYVFCPLLVENIAIYHKGQTNSAKYLLQWPGAFAVFIGLVSDRFPIAGFRRKSYMLLGWCMAAVMFGAMAVVYFATSATSSPNGYLYLAFSLLAALGMQIAWIASLAMTVEFAQREHLYQRGHLQSLYMFTYFTAGAATLVVCSTLVSMKEDGKSLVHELNLGQAMLVLVGGCLAPLPFIGFSLAEDKTTTSMRTALTGGRVSDLWHFLQHKVVYNMLFFLVGLVFLNGAYHHTASQAVMLWSGITFSKSNNVYIVKAVAHVVAALIWKAGLVNYNWRKLAAFGVLLKAVVNTLLALTTIYAAVRNEWYFYLLTALNEIPRTWLEMFTLIPPTEIADPGREGATVGLVTSFMVLITIATKTLWDSLSDGFGINDVTAKDVVMDLASTRNSLCLAALIYVAINLSSVGLVGFIPSQKLDAQHLRSFGGYNPTARLVLFVAFLLLLTYSLVANLRRIFA